MHSYWIRDLDDVGLELEIPVQEAWPWMVLLATAISATALMKAMACSCGADRVALCRPTCATSNSASQRDAKAW